MTDLNETIATFNKAWNAGEYGDLGLDSGLADETEYQQNYAPQRAAMPPMTQSSKMALPD